MVLTSNADNSLTYFKIMAFALEIVNIPPFITPEEASAYS
jgi:hypothetical protein